MTASKYRNVRTKRDGLWFASKLEADRYSQLRLLETAGAISGLVCQQPFTCVVGGVVVTKYIADFTFIENGKRVIEDAKGFQTEVFKLKRKLVEACHGVKITLVGKKQMRTLAIDPARIRRAA